MFNVVNKYFQPDSRIRCHHAVKPWTVSETASRWLLHSENCFTNNNEMSANYQANIDETCY